MFRKTTIPALLVTALVISPLSAFADSDYYTKNKKSYGITNTKSLKEATTEVTNASYRDGSNSVNVGIEGGSLAFENNSNPTLSVVNENDKQSIYQVMQNGPLVIRDNRFSGEGWSLYLEAQPLTMIPKEGQTYKNGLYVAKSGKVMYSGNTQIDSLNSSTTIKGETGFTSSDGEEELKNKPVTSAEKGLPTTLNYPVAVPIDGQKIRIAYAYKGEGMGDWQLANVLSNVYITVDSSLKQDKKSYPNGPTPYQTKFEWTLVSGPGNN